MKLKQLLETIDLNQKMTIKSVDGTAYYENCHFGLFKGIKNLHVCNICSIDDIIVITLGTKNYPME